MNWSEVGKTVAKVAPALGAALAGPIGIGVTAAGALAASVLGVEATPAAVAAAVAADPDMPLKLAQVEVQAQQIVAQQAMAQMAADTAALQAEVDDRKSARQREVETHDITPKVLAGAIVLGWFGFQWFLLTHVIDPAMRDFTQRMLGTLDMAVAMVLQYHFGSTAGSRRKTELLAKTSPAAEPNAVNG